MITREMVSEKLIAFLDERLSLNQVVVWAEHVMAEGNYAPDSNIDLLVNIVMRLAGTDAPQPALAQEARSGLGKRPEMAIRVLPRDAA